MFPGEDTRSAVPSADGKASHGTENQGAEAVQTGPLSLIDATMEGFYGGALIRY